VGELIGVLIAIVSSCLGGTAAAVTRYLGANTMTVNPIAAALLARQLVGEPIIVNLVVGLLAVFAGIWFATTEAATG
jgi:hypothetical protein